MQIHKAIRWKDTAEWLENLHLLSTTTKYICVTANYYEN